MELNLDYFKEYYNSGKFEEGMKRYFKITQSPKNVNMILHVDRHFNDDVPMPHLSLMGEEGMEKSICFAIIFYYICLFNYLINKLGGKEILIDFLKATGWPIVSCGLGGIMNPNHTMVEADLVFVHRSVNQKRSIQLFQEVKPFMKKELDEFFQGHSPSLNEESYHRFCTDFSPYVSKFWEQAEEEIEHFTFLK